MEIKSIEITNFKSFDKLSIELGKFNVLIGANASGKTNFVNILRFIRDLDKHGLSNALSIQGGAKYLRNRKIDQSKGCSIKLIIKHKIGFSTRKKKRTIGIESEEAIHSINFDFQGKRSECNISSINLINRCNFFELEKDKDQNLKEKEFIGTGEFILTYDNDKITYDSKMPKNISPTLEDIFLISYLDKQENEFKRLLKEKPFFNPFFPFFSYTNDIAIYDLNPKLPKNAVKITGIKELEEDGSNLSIVLKHIKEDEESSRKFLNLMKDLLPFVDDLNVEELEDSSLFFNIRENYLQNQSIPSFLISDGTINIAALVAALHFEKSEICIIEEPERSIHPLLISKVVEMIKESSEKKQIIITTHNPEVLKHAGLENIFLISRDKNGFSKIEKPMNKDKVKTFLKNKIGLDELFVQDLLIVE